MAKTATSLVGTVSLGKFCTVDGMRIWYNDNDPFVAEWLRNLIAAGHLPDGIVDENPIQEIKPKDCAPTSHFFAGIGGWAYALQFAGWPEGSPVWTGSCPCQPFSNAGKRCGTIDPRHLWSEWFRLIKKCHPPVVFGEQVASKDGYAWFDIVQADLEGLGYACGMVVSPAAGYGAPHIRHRIYFVADAERNYSGRKTQSANFGQSEANRSTDRIGGHGESSLMADAESDGLQRKVGSGDGKKGKVISTPSQYGPTSGFWANAEWLDCTDRKARPTQPGLFPLAHGVPSRVGRLRAYGNAIVPPQAAEFIRAYIAIR